jgi:DNA-binding LytR/AlgR family response regulator
MPIEADNHGTAEGEITVPEGVPAGTVLMEVVGDQGSTGNATYTASGTITTEARRIVNTVLTRYDPLAQTFTLSEGRHIAGVDLWFKAKGTSRVLVQIRETTVGFPNQNVMAQASIYPVDININGTHTRVLFTPIWLEANVEYAIVILTDDAETAVVVAELGKFDSIHNTYITKQAYQVGVLLSSSNASTWTAHQDLDLAFRLLSCRFTETEHLINFGTITAVENTNLLTLANIERVSSETDVEFIYTDSEGKTNTLAEDMPVALKEKIDGEVSVRAKLKGSTTRSPVLFQGVQAVLGTMDETCDYVTRAITAGTNISVKIVYESYTPGNSQVKAYVQNPDSTWTLVALTSGSPVGDGWEEHTHVAENFSGAMTRIKLVLEGNVLYRPQVRNLKVFTVA